MKKDVKITFAATEETAAKIDKIREILQKRDLVPYSRGQVLEMAAALFLRKLEEEKKAGWKPPLADSNPLWYFYQ